MVQENDIVTCSLDDSTIETKGEVVEYNVSYFDDCIKGKRESSKEVDAIKEAMVDLFKFQVRMNILLKKKKINLTSLIE